MRLLTDGTFSNSEATVISRSTFKTHSIECQVRPSPDCCVSRLLPHITPFLFTRLNSEITADDLLERVLEFAQPTYCRVFLVHPNPISAALSELIDSPLLPFRRSRPGLSASTNVHTSPIVAVMTVTSSQRCGRIERWGPEAEARVRPALAAFASSARL
jgi:hypothetical protein